MDDWVQVYLGAKYTPGQPRDQGGRFSGHGGYSEMTPKLATNLKGEEDRICDLSKEELFVYDKNGNLLASGKGDETHVGPESITGKIKRGAIATHNHPNGYSFSEADVQFAIANKLGEMRAVGVDQSNGAKVVFRIAPGASGKWPTSAKVTRARGKTREVVKKSFWDAVRRGDMSPEEANSEIHHTIWFRVAEELGMKYGMESLR